MNTSIAIHASAGPRPLLSAPLRIATVVAIVLLMLLAVTAARHESQLAVRTASDLLSGGTVHVTLPAVEVVGRRDRAGPARAGGAG